MDIFTLFPKLPAELRHYIWSLAAHPHTIYLFRHPNCDGPAHRRVKELMEQGLDRYDDEVVDAIHIANDECSVSIRFKILPAMQGCREAYHLFKPLFEGQKPLEPSILPWIYLDQDIVVGYPDILRPLYLQHPWFSVAVRHFTLRYVYYLEDLFDDDYVEGKPLVEFYAIEDRFPSLKTVTIEIDDKRKLVTGQYPNYYWLNEWIEPMRSLYHPQQPYDSREAVGYRLHIINTHQPEDEWITPQNYLRQWHRWILKRDKMYNLAIPEEGHSPDPPFDPSYFIDVIKLDDDDLDRPDVWWKKHGPFEHL